MAFAATAVGSARRFLSSAALAGLLVGGLSVVTATIVDQRRGLASASAGVVLVLAYFWTGQVVERSAMRLANSQGMVLIMSGYLVRVVLLGFLLSWALSSATPASLVSQLWVGAGAFAAVIGWLSGLIVVHSRMRIPIYDQPYVAPKGWDA